MRTIVNSLEPALASDQEAVERLVAAIARVLAPPSGDTRSRGPARSTVDAPELNAYIRARWDLDERMAADIAWELIERVVLEPDKDPVRDGRPLLAARLLLALGTDLPQAITDRIPGTQLTFADVREGTDVKLAPPNVLLATHRQLMAAATSPGRRSRMLWATGRSGTAWAAAGVLAALEEVLADRDLRDDLVEQWESDHPPTSWASPAVEDSSDEAIDRDATADVTIDAAESSSQHAPDRARRLHWRLAAVVAVVFAVGAVALFAYETFDLPAHNPPADRGTDTASQESESASGPSGDPKTPSESSGSGSQTSAPPVSAHGDALYLKDIRCVRRAYSVRVFAYFLQLGNGDGHIVYKIDGNKWTTDDIYSDTTPRSRNFEVTGVHYLKPVKCEVSLEAQYPNYEQSVQATSN